MLIISPRQAEGPKKERRSKGVRPFFVGFFAEITRAEKGGKVKLIL